MKILQSKLNPHFLFNSLNAIQYHVAENDKKGALQYLTHFSSFLRKVLQSGDELLIPVGDEATLAEQYLWLEQNRFPEKFTYIVNVSTDAEMMQTPPMLVHSMLQASLYMNVLNAGSKLYTVHVNFSVKDDELIVQVRDNGPEKNEEADLKNTGGLSAGNTDILTQRLKVINSSALKPVTLNYSRTQNENIAELTINQPLFNT
jgi:LytS/YehU family sensor histidine kinase